MNKKITIEKANFCSNTAFSLYFEIRVKKIQGAKPIAFSIQFHFRRDQSHFSNLISKIKKMCESLKKQRPFTTHPLNCKKTALQYNSNILNCKNPEYSFAQLTVWQLLNIAVRLLENSRNRFVDRQSKKNSKKDRPKKTRPFIEG